MMKRLCAMMLALAMMLGAGAALAEEPAAEETVAEVAEAVAEEAVEAVEEPMAEAAAETVEEAVEEAVAEAAEEKTAEEVPDTLLVTLNGKEIRENDEMLQFWKDYLIENSGVDPEEYKVMIQQYAMDYTLHYTLIAQELEKMGKSATQEDAEALLRQEWENYVNDVMTNMIGIGEDATDEEKASAREQAISYITMTAGYTEENFMQELPMAKIILLNNMLQELVADDVKVTDEEVEAHFNAMVEEDKEMIGDSAEMYEYYPYYVGRNAYYMPEGYRGITHILLKVDDELLKTWQDLVARLEEQNEPDAEITDTEEAGTEATETEAPEETPAPEETVTQEMVDAAKQAILDSVQDKIKEIGEKLEAGTSFEDLILEYGTDPGMEDEENRKNGYAVHADSIKWEPNFTEGAMKLEKVGDVSEPVVGSYGVHILHYLRDIPGGAVELTDAMKAEIRATLEAEKLNTAVDEKVEPWMEASEIVWTEEGKAWQLESAEE